MLSYQTLKKTQLALQGRHKREYAQVLETLIELDPGARALEYPAALTSKSLVRALWDALPDEHESLQFASPEAQTVAEVGIGFASATRSVTLHLGWGMLAFATTYHAAWHAWPRFSSVLPDAYNACIYPEDLKWYVVRAGTRLYLMDCTRGLTPALVGK